MSKFYIVNESTEDTLESTDNFEEALRFAREAAKQGLAGDPVSILNSDGKSVGQFVLTPDGTVKELRIASEAKPFDAKRL